MSAPDYKPFYPSIQRIDRRYTSWKLLMLLFTVAGLFWVFEGRALYRRYIVGLDDIPEKQRNGDGFLAVTFPRVTKDGERFTISDDDYEATLKELKARGFTSIGVKDVRDFYEKARPLPPKPVLLAFDRDNPDSVALADKGLRRARMRGLLFIDKTTPKAEDGRVYNFSMSPHAMNQMLKSGAWDLGWYSDDTPHWHHGDLVRPPVIDMGEPMHEWTRNPFLYPMRFVVARGGYNDANRLMSALNIFRVRTDMTPDENVKTLTASWPRKLPFVDDFKKDGLGLDWVSERGVAVAIDKRMVLVPTPRQRSASAYLSGTDGWRDLAVEFTLAKYRRVTWLYARAAEDRWLRVGIENGYWMLQEKTGTEHKPVTLARAPMNIATTLPARVRLVLKGPWAIVHVNGRMQYGKAVRVHSGIDAGRVELDVYDPKPGTSLGVITHFAAAPLGPRWISVNRDEVAGDPSAEKRLVDGVRDEAVYANVLSPRWMDVLADGRVSPVDDDRQLLRELAGYYRCLLVPMVDFAAPQARIPADRAQADQLLDGVIAALAGSEAVGLNIRISPSRAQPERAAYFLSRLRQRLHDQKRRLWITLDGPERAAPWLKEADGVLRPVRELVPGASLLEPRG